MTLDIDIPYLVVSLLLSVVGFALYRYGKRTEKYSWILSGITLCVFPYFVSNVYLLMGIASIVVVIPFFTTI